MDLWALVEFVWTLGLGLLVLGLGYELGLNRANPPPIAVVLGSSCVMGMSIHAQYKSCSAMKEVGESTIDCSYLGPELTHVMGMSLCA